MADLPTEYKNFWEKLLTYLCEQAYSLGRKTNKAEGERKMSTRKLWPKDLFAAVQRDEEGDEILDDDQTRAILRKLKADGWLKPLPKHKTYKIAPLQNKVLKDDYKWPTHHGEKVIVVRSVEATHE